MTQTSTTQTPAEIVATLNACTTTAEAEAIVAALAGKLLNQVGLAVGAVHQYDTANDRRARIVRRTVGYRIDSKAIATWNITWSLPGEN